MEMDKDCAAVENVIALAERSAALPLVYVGTGSGWATAPAPYLELVYMFEGECSALRMGPEVFAFPNGHVGLLSVHHGNYAVGPQRFRGWCVFLDVAESPEFAGCRETPLFGTWPVEHPQRMVAAFEHLATECGRSGRVSPGYPPRAEFAGGRGRNADRPAEVFMKAAFLHLTACVLEEAGGPSSHAPLPEAVREAMRLVELNYRRPDVDLARIARAVHLSPDHLGRLYRKATGRSPVRYLRQVRIDRSCFLLRQTTTRIEAIAREVGFEDPYHFSRVFRAERGICPREYRRRESGRE